MTIQRPTGEDVAQLISSLRKEASIQSESELSSVVNNTGVCDSNVGNSLNVGAGRDRQIGLVGYPGGSTKAAGMGIKDILKYINHTNSNSRLNRLTKARLLNLFRRQYLKKAVVNLTGKTISTQLTKILEKGVKIIPTKKYSSKQLVSSAIERIRRRMYLDFYFSNKVTNYQPHPFRGPSTWIPPKPLNGNADKFSNCIEKRIHQSITSSARMSKHNLTKIDITNLRSMGNNSNWVIKQADKGGALVVWGKYAYLKEVERQLSDNVFYEPCEADEITNLTSELASF